MLMVKFLSIVKGGSRGVPPLCVHTVSMLVCYSPTGYWMATHHVAVFDAPNFIKESKWILYSIYFIVHWLNSHFLLVINWRLLGWRRSRYTDAFWRRMWTEWDQQQHHKLDLWFRGLVYDENNAHDMGTLVSPCSSSYSSVSTYIERKIIVTGEIAYVHIHFFQPSVWQTISNPYQ